MFKILKCDPLEPVCKSKQKIKFDLHYEIVQPLKRNVSIKIEYLWNSTISPPKEDLVLEEVELDEVKEVGKRKAILECDPPKLESLPKDAPLDIGALVVKAIYDNKTFYRNGFFVRHDIPGVEPEDVKHPLDFTKIMRDISVKGRVTNINIPWDNEEQRGTKRPREEADENQDGEVRPPGPNGPIDMEAILNALLPKPDDLLSEEDLEEEEEEGDMEEIEGVDDEQEEDDDL